MSLAIYLMGGGLLTLLCGGLVSLVAGRQAGFRVCRILSAIATGFPLLLLILSFIIRDPDEDGRSVGLMFISALAMLPASLSCWLATWYMHPRPPAVQEHPGLSREVPRDANS